MDISPAFHSTKYGRQAQAGRISTSRPLFMLRVSLAVLAPQHDEYRIRFLHNALFSGLSEDFPSTRSTSKTGLTPGRFAFLSHRSSSDHFVHILGGQGDLTGGGTHDHIHLADLFTNL